MFYLIYISGREDKTQVMDYNFSPDPKEIINVISYMSCFCVVLCSIICFWNAQPKSPTSVISLIKDDTRMIKVKSYINVSLS